MEIHLLHEKMPGQAGLNTLGRTSQVQVAEKLFEKDIPGWQEDQHEVSWAPAEESEYENNEYPKALCASCAKTYQFIHILLSQPTLPRRSEG